jgi:hypothetical protein
MPVILTPLSLRAQVKGIDGSGYSSMNILALLFSAYKSNLLYIVRRSGAWSTGGEAHCGEKDAA